MVCYFLLTSEEEKVTNDTKVTFLKNDKVKLVMPLEDYRRILEGSNDLKGAVNMMHECHTIYLEDLGKLETFEWRLADYLGFKRRVGQNRYHGDYVLCNHPEAKED
jgi:hypothetical protein